MSAPSPQRIVSLLPAATEILGLLEIHDSLVGRSHECDYPPEVRRAPVLSTQRVSPADPAAIDQAVSSHLAAGESLYILDETALRDLRPDLILTQSLCNVCSIDLTSVQRAAAEITPRPAVIDLNPHTLEDVLDDIGRVGQAVGRETRAMHAVVALRERLSRAQEFVNAYEQGPSVAFLEWTAPLFCAGHWTVQLIERAGGRHPINPTRPGPKGDAAAPSRRIQPEDLLAAEPEFLVICPCGASLDTARDWAASLARQPWWGSLPAVRSGRVALVDGNQMFNRPGPRLVDAFEFLVGFIQVRPHLIPSGFPWRLLP